MYRLFISLFIIIGFYGCRPHFDHDKPDTNNNKDRLQEFLKIEITSDIHNIYCFDDAVGIDADYQFAFNCNPTTANKIIRINGLKRDTLNTDYGFGMQNDFRWWDKNKIASLPLYSWKGENEYYKYFWYDPVEQKAYFFDFDM